MSVAAVSTTPATMAVPVAPPKSAGAIPKSAGKQLTGTAKVQHPPYGEMIKAALQHYNERKGSSRAAIFKYIIENYKLGGDMAAINSHLRAALKRGIKSGALKQAKGNGAAGSVRLGKLKTKKSGARKRSKGARRTGPKKPRVHKSRKSSSKKSKGGKKRMSKKSDVAKKVQRSKKRTAKA